jgi:hypothetical protein
LSETEPLCNFAEESKLAGDQMNEPKVQKNGERERRTKRRFGIEQEVRYKMLYGQRIAETGAGKTMNISSGGVWFTTENLLTAGMPVELSMNWPVLLNDSCPMKLMIYGCVIRSNDKGAAVAIERYEFRTQGSRSFQTPSLPHVELRMLG